MKNIVVLVSGGGTNLQALIDAQESGIIKGGKITCVIASKEGAYALERAKKHNIKGIVCPRKEYPDSVSYSKEILRLLQEEKADLIVYAGFMIILDEMVSRAYPNRIMNVHPAEKVFMDLEFTKQHLKRALRLQVRQFILQMRYAMVDLSFCKRLLMFLRTIHLKHFNAELWNSVSGRFSQRQYHFSVRIDLKL